MAVGDTSTATHLAQTPHTPHDRRRDHLKGIGCRVADRALWGVSFLAPR